MLASHTHPDGDAIGSLIAMGLALNEMKKDTALYNESPIPAVYRFLPSVNRVVRRLGEQKSYDTAIILDCGNLERIGKAAAHIRHTPVIINIDHHVTNSLFGNFQLIDTSACATAEIIYRLIKRMGVPPTRDMATALYTAILTDTGSFRFSNTNSAAFAICDEMVGLGVDPSRVAKHVYGTYSMGRLKLLNLALDSIEISNNGKLSMMTLTRDMLRKTDTQPEDADGIINYAKRIEDVRVAVMIQEHLNGLRGVEHSTNPGRFHVSLRSDGTVDVAAIASEFGGGGHYNAAGFSVDATMSELKNRIFALASNL